MRNAAAVLLGMALIWTGAGQTAFALDAMPKVPINSEDWYRLEIMGIHVGSMWTHSEQVESEIVVQSELVMKLSRVGFPVDVRQTRVARFDAEPPYAPRSFSYIGREMDVEKRIEGRAVGEEMHLSILSGGKMYEKTIGMPAGAVFEEAIPFLLQDRAFKVGDKASYFTFNYELLTPISYRVSAIDSEDEETFAIVYLLEQLQVEVTSYLNKDGSVLETVIPLGAMSLRMALASEKEATETPEGRFDIVISTKTEFQGAPPSDPELFTAEARLPNKELSDAAPNTHRQTLTPIADSDWMSLEVKRDAEPQERVPYPIKSAELEPFLSSTLYVQADNPDIRAKAAEIVDGTEGAWEAAKRISEWTHTYVKEKRFDRGYATAKETLDSRSGDCTEHTMLAVALTRAAGIPARIVSGVVWMKDGFYYHFWHEAYVGEWIALDATLGQTPADARRIQLSRGELESDTALELTFGVLQTLNMLELRASPK
ncbi:MAG: transglutaminase-like domain-containing protein [Candidatus Poribacteria bacterium]|nr:transglutaminase-like domain-containing protein [Candidatus Poribacteria bacterium]